MLPTFPKPQQEGLLKRAAAHALSCREGKSDLR